MNPIKIVTISLLAFTIAACGGGGSPDSSSDTAGSGTDGGTPIVTTPDTGGTTTVPVSNLRFGSGEGESFVPGKIALDQSYTLLAGSLQVSVNVVDNGNANTIVTDQPYLFKFSSICSSESTPRASFNVTSLGSTTGTAGTTYKNISCSGNDTLTVKLLSQDGTVEIAEATANITGYAPQLGSGSGPGYFDGIITGSSDIEPQSSTTLQADVVDRANSNALIVDPDKEKYTVVWSSSCPNSTFSITTEKLGTGNLQTRYDANSCVGNDVVTLSIFATSNLSVPLDIITKNMQIGDDNSAVAVLSDLVISDDHVLAGSNLGVSVNGIDDNNGSRLSGEYKYQFVTDCAAGTAEFSSAIIESSTGLVNTALVNKNCVMVGDTTLTINLFEAGADVVADAPLSTLTTKFKTAYPKFGFGSGADFVVGKIEGVTKLVEDASTKLTVNTVDVLSLNSLINSDNYVAQWSADCAAATFSIQSQSLSTPTIVTRYDANTCTGVDTVRVKLFAKDDLATELDSTELSLTISSNAGVTVDAQLSNIELSGTHALAGQSLELNIKGIDAQNDNKQLVGNYLYSFETSCADTSFAQASIQSNSGLVVNNYNNTACGAVGTSSTDTLTVSLYEASDLSTALDTKTITINTSYPKLGFGSGADFVAGKIEGVTKLLEDASTLLTVNAVDVLNLNSLINSDDYVAQWSADCAAATFSIESQSLSTPTIVTRYNANTCTGNDVVRVKLFAKNDLATELNSTTLSLTINPIVDVTVDAKLSDIVLSNSHALAGESLTLSINGFDADNGNALLTDNYVYTFASSCVGTSFDQASIQSNKGAVESTYQNVSCGAIGTASTDTLTVNLYDASDLATSLDTKTVTINTSYPKLGFGSGADFVSGKIEGITKLVEEASTKLTVNAVDVLNLNSLINSDNYVAQWSADCAAATFSIESQSLSTPSIVTRYDANTCTGTDTVRVKLFAKDDLVTELNTTSISLTISSVAGVVVDAKLSDINLSSDHALAGQTLTLGISGIDVLNGNEPLTDNYVYTFETSCVGTSFAQASIQSNAGSVANSYINTSCGAVGTSSTDTLTVSLYEASDLSTALDTKTITINTSYPKLGFGSGADFVAGKIEGVTKLLEDASTLLTVNAVDVLNLNSLINSDDYVAQWSADCAAATFSIESQSLSTPTIVTRYNANTCTGNDVVRVKLFAKNDLATELNSTTLSLTINPIVDVTVDAKLSDIVLSNSHALAGESLTLSINGFDADNGNALLTDNYVYTFASSCVGTSFDQASIQSNKGAVESTYQNVSCGAIGTASTDTLTVNLYDASDLATSLDTKTVTINTSYPKLGFGSGADFVSGKIEGITKLVEEASTKLTVNAVDVLNLNSLINSDNYVAQWSADCAAATFSIESQSLSTPSIVTRYDANTCTGTDTVRVKLFAKDDLVTELNTTSISLTISSVAGVVVDAKLSDINLSSDHALAGQTLTLGISGIDVLNGNEPLTDNYVYTFETSCVGTSFAQASIQSNAGFVESSYLNTSCGAIGSTSTDILTVKLYEASDLATVLDTKSVMIDTSYPELGFGTGADFVSSLINGNTVLTNSLSSKLTANAVDNLNLNSKINSNDYVVIWSSSCANSTFSITKQSLATGNAETRYDANTCTTSDTVKLSLYAKGDLATELDSAILIMSIGQTAGVEVDPKLGFGNGSDYSDGQLRLSADYALAGSSITVIVNGVNIKDNNALLTGNYLYKFESTCPANSTSFSSNVIASNNGVVNNTYTNRQCQVTDTITVSLFAEGADTAVDAPLATATGSVDTALPKIGSKTGADFIDGVIDGNANLVDSASTYLSATVVDPLNVNKALTSSDYYVEWSSACATAKFSITSQNISSDIKTRYDGDADLCQADVVTLTLFNKFDDSLVSTTIDISVNESLVPAEAALGTGEVGTFVAETLAFSQSNISARQTIAVSVNIVDIKDAANTLITDTEYAVKFDSFCVKDERASFDRDLVRTTSGIATVYYTSSGCTASDTISAVLYAIENNEVNDSSSLSTAKGVITIETPDVNSIEYQGMTSRQIALKGISFTSLPEVTEVSFILKDEYNKPVGGRDVTFSLSNASVDATLSGEDVNGKVVATTNEMGVVTAYVNSGKTHGTVSVLATADKDSGGVLRTQSFGISITTGIPVQPSLSLALDKLNPRGWNAIGSRVTATVQLADRFHNPVPDGTIVNFITDGGFIEPTCETRNGTCTANWTSGNPRPGFSKDNSQGALQKSKTLLEHPTNDSTSQFHFNKNAVCGADDSAVACDSYRQVEVDASWNGGRSGLVTILAYVEGEADFADANGNGRFDDGEDFSAMAEAYLDANEDSAYTAPDENNPFEQLIEYVQDGVMTAAPPTYQGGSCTEDARIAGHCSSLVHIRQSARLVMSSDDVSYKLESMVGGASGDLVAGECVNVYNEGTVTFNFAVNDYNGNTPIGGAQQPFVANGFVVDNYPPMIPNKASIEPLRFPVTIRKDDEYGNGFARLSANHPVDGEAGFILIDNLTDDPLIKISTTDFLLDVDSGPQILEYTFTDSCGNPPGAGDIIIFEVEEVVLSSYTAADVITTDPVTNVKTTAATPTARGTSFQVYGNQLTSEGAYRIQIEHKAVSPSTEDAGILRVRTINVNANGIENIKTSSIKL